MAASAQGGTPRRAPYRPPADGAVREVRFETLLRRGRSIPSTQQKRLGFSSLEGGPPMWCAGNIGLLDRPCIAIVGTRKISAAGAARARRLAKELSEFGVVVVSGLAMGVDAEAMASAIRSGGNVVGVIGTPLDKASPAQNARLQEEVYREHLLISQFPAESRVYRGNFPARNRTMAAISDATVIIEASDTSGTLHQAAECHRLGRWLFIAKSVVEDASLSWPSKFLNGEKTRVLSHTSDLLCAIER